MADGEAAETTAQSLLALPPEIAQEVLKSLEPGALVMLREVSVGACALVDNYVQDLLTSGQLKDGSGLALAESFLDPAEALQAWAHNQAGTDAFPIQFPPIDLQAVQAKFDRAFGLSQGHLGIVYDAVILEGGQRGLELRDEMEAYVGLLLQHNRLTTNTGAALPPGMTALEAWDLWRQGLAQWQPQGL